MKKRFSGIVLLLLLAVGLTACGGQGETKQGMTIRPSEFSEETQKVLAVVDDELAFFDYAVDESIRSKSVNIWQYKDGQWVSAGQTFGDLDERKATIAIRLNDASYDIIEITDSGRNKYSSKSVVDFSTAGAQSAKRLDGPTTITAGTEIPLWVVLGYENDRIDTSNATGDFRQADCVSGLAVTVTIYEEAMEHYVNAASSSTSR